MILLQLLSGMNIASTITGNAPVAPPASTCESEHLDQSFEVAIQSRPSHRRLGSAFRDPSMSLALGHSLWCAFQNMREYVIFREFQLRSGDSLPLCEAMHFHSKAWNAYYSALRIPFDERTATDEIAEPCRVAMLIFWNANNQLNGPDSLLYTSLAQKLRHGLEMVELDVFYERYPKVLLWTLLLGAFVSSKPRRTWFLTQIAHVLSRDNISWQEMRLHLLDMLYIESIYEVGFAQCWEEAVVLTHLF